MKHQRMTDIGRSASEQIGELTRLRGLVREATLAASNYNTQPWTFRPGNRSVSIFPDRNRRCPVIDPDDHHLYVSLGCATENLVCGGRANGLFGYVDNGEDRIEVDIRGIATTPHRAFTMRCRTVSAAVRATTDGRSRRRSWSTSSGQHAAAACTRSSSPRGRRWNRSSST